MTDLDRSVTVESDRRASDDGTGPVGADRVDGRTARRDRNRTAVLDAVLGLFAEGALAPGVHEVAARSGVSLRSVYRYFEDADELIGAAITRQLELAAPLFRIDGLGDGPLEARIERFCQRRIGLYVELRDVHLAARVRAGSDAQVRSGVRMARRWLSRQVRAMFAPEIDRQVGPEATRLAAAVDVACQFDTLEYLLDDCSLDAPGAVHHLRSTLLALLR